MSDAANVTPVLGGEVDKRTAKQPKKPSRRAQIGAAHRAVRKLPRPQGMRHGTWLLLKEVLIALNVHLPDPFPSQRLLAAKVGISQAAVSRLLVMAEKAELIIRVEKPGRHGERPRHVYSLLYAPSPDSLSTLDQMQKRFGPDAEATPKSVPKKEETKAAAAPNPTPLRGVGSDPPAGRGRHTQAEEDINRKPGYCVACGVWVKVGEGKFQENEDGRLRAVHLRCYGSEPGSRDPYDEEAAAHRREVLERWHASEEYNAEPVPFLDRFKPSTS